MACIIEYRADLKSMPIPVFIISLGWLPQLKKNPSRIRLIPPG